ncbi:hypothetical protein CKA32_000017 [Geitlerinema sp. FC II]|nr:hypothetical protein CKA32_000017 [Geitlerinema sp. FC II]
MELPESRWRDRAIQAISLSVYRAIASWKEKSMMKTNSA